MINLAQVNKISEAELRIAKSHVDSLRLCAAYKIFHRYYGQLPFRVDAMHAEHIGRFTKVLVALRKRRELLFYVRALEGHQEKGVPYLDYSLGLLYQCLPHPNWEKSRESLEKVISAPTAAKFHQRARLLLARYYDERNDIASCRKLVFRDADPNDSGENYHIAQIWKAVVCRREGNLGEALSHIKTLVELAPPAIHWYDFLSSRIALANILIDRNELARAASVVRGLKRYFQGPYFTFIQQQMRILETVLTRKSIVARIKQSPEDSKLFYPDESRSFVIPKRLHPNWASELIGSGVTDRRNIVENVM
jgi:hypothetical protein